MVRTTVVAMVLACSFAWTGCTTDSATRDRRDAARRENDSLAASIKRDVIEMKRAGIADDVVINLLRVSHSYFPMSTRDVVQLADSGVSDSVLNAMILGFQAETRERSSVASAYYAPYYWSNPYWYSWDPYFSFGFGYYPPFFGYRTYVPVNHFAWGGGMRGFHEYGHSGMGGRRRR
jgi:hypothetical protein